MDDTQVNVRINTTDETKSAVESAKSGFSGLWKSVAGGVIASQAAFAAMNVLRTGIDDVKTAYKENQDQLAQLTTATQNANGQWGVSKDKAIELANAMSKQTGITRESVMAAQNQLLTFTHIGKEAFPAATQAVADLATKLNNGAIPTMQQMGDVSIMVGKALDDPIKGLVALHKRGVDFTEQQKEQIKTMVESGNTLGAQKLILGEIQHEYKGAAEAAGTTFAGAIAKAKNAVIEFAVDEVPKAIAELEKVYNWFVKIGGVKDIKIIFHDLAVAARDTWIFLGLLYETIRGGDPTIQKGQESFSGIAKVLSVIGYYLRETVKILTTIFVDAWHIVKTAVDMLMPSLQALWNALASNVIPAVKEIYQAFVRLYTSLQPALMDVLKVLAVIIGATLYAAIWLIINGLRIAIEVFSVMVRSITDLIKWISNLIGWFGGLGGMIVHAVGSFGHLLYDAGRDLIQGMINGVKDMAGHAVNAVKNVGKDMISGIKSVLKIFSPSAVFHDIGANIGAGLIQGVEVMQPGAQQSVNALVTGSPLLNSNGSPSSIVNNSSTTTYGGKQTVSIGQINLGSASAVQEFFAHLNQDSINANKGLSVVQGAF